AVTYAPLPLHDALPVSQLREVRDVPYGDDSGGTTLDVFTRAAEGERRPTVVWIHGGAWISGSTGDVEPYLRILAAHGYTTIGVGDRKSTRLNSSHVKIA